ncbi:PQQ-dependent sugar dehydrogenase [Luteolibacter yonseiensis]|uniref:PQQ-dependent sugar dehydrogenase n=1 Tax=Luteolibacter yonseiensis TaxID=1144680 RepID=A0A934R550_9BACT|nr:PQQ-dependent sugar dehydrogenase [Luteolibacter yonseiensis]MBK1815440.1 PQQ-dependent sugar dehydrogenase [Luteolibacter yonseiensis]
MRKTLPLVLLSLAAANAAPLQKQTIAGGFHDPMSITVAPDGDIYLVEREGKLLRIRPGTGGVFEIGNLTVSALRSTDPKSNSAVEDGLQGIALDPDFAKNQRIYLYYSHPEKLLDRLSRFTLKDGKLDVSSELVLIDVPSERHDRICHHGGSVQFGPDGLLYLSIGDNTNPFDSDGYAPIDNRENRLPWDAQRSAGNTNDLRGKILRIRPTETGYDIPPGNLFPKGTPKTRPEIYVMGCRNPFRISIDPKNSTLYWGEVGPDASKPSDKGPAGHDEVNQAKAAGNFGWPFLVGDNKPYPIVDFTTGKPGRMTDPAKPQNTGIRNTGLTDLPPAQSAFIWYPYDESPEFPVMGKGGRNAMAGPVFYHDSGRKYNILDKSDDHTLLTYDWVRAKIWKAKLGNGEKLVRLESFDDLSKHPMDMEMAADGSIWLLDYGTEWWFNKNGSLIHVLPESANRPPQIEIEAVADKPLTYTVKSATDPENDPITVTWWLTTGTTERKLGSGKSITIEPNSGSEIRAVASDGKSPNAVARISLTQEAAAPELKLSLDGDPKSLGFGESVGFKITAEKSPDAAQVSVRARYIPATGHDAGGPQFPAAINALVTSNLCLACHQVDVTSVGPAYVNVALKYRGQADALDKLKAKVKAGGGGVWGEVPMPPQIALKDEDADTILRAVLGLAEGISETKGSNEGKITLAPKPAGAEGGAWEFSAEAPGYTTAKFRIPAK